MSSESVPFSPVQIGDGEERQPFQPTIGAEKMGIPPLCLKRLLESSQYPPPDPNTQITQTHALDNSREIGITNNDGDPVDVYNCLAGKCPAVITATYDSRRMTLNFNELVPDNGCGL